MRNKMRRWHTAHRAGKCTCLERAVALGLAHSRKVMPLDPDCPVHGHLMGEEPPPEEEGLEP